MSWTDDAFLPSATLDRVGVAELRDKAVDGVVALCGRQPTRCLADAARLSALIEGSADGAPSDKTDRSEEAVASPVPPMPVPDPRRRARDAQLTRAR